MKKTLAEAINAALQSRCYMIGITYKPDGHEGRELRHHLEVKTFPAEDLDKSHAEIGKLIEGHKKISSRRDQLPGEGEDGE